MEAIKTIFIDLETNSPDPFIAEPIEGSFIIVDKNYNIIDKYKFNSQVSFWSEEAERIHKIRYADTLAYPDKNKAYHQLLEWLSSHKPYKIACYANPNYFGQHITFDIAVLKKELHFLYGDFVTFHQYIGDKVLNPYLIVKELHRQNKITIFKNDKLTHFSLENVVLNLLSKKYNAHNAESDNIITIELMKYLDKIKHGSDDILFNAFKS